MELTSTTTVNRPPGEVYDFWRRVDRLPTFLAHLDEVQLTGLRTSRWKAGARSGTAVEWDTVTTADVPDRHLAWRSVEGADVDSSGELRLAPSGTGTDVRVTLRYAVPGDLPGAAVARWFGADPAVELDHDLGRFRRLLDAGAGVRPPGIPGPRRELPPRRLLPGHSGDGPDGGEPVAPAP